MPSLSRKVRAFRLARGVRALGANAVSSVTKRMFANRRYAKSGRITRSLRSTSIDPRFGRIKKSGIRRVASRFSQRYKRLGSGAIRHMSFPKFRRSQGWMRKYPKAK